GPGTVHLVRGDGGPGNSKGSPSAGEPFHGGRSTLAGVAGSPCSRAANTDAESMAPENMRRETLFIDPPVLDVRPVRMFRIIHSCRGRTGGSAVPRGCG